MLLLAVCGERAAGDRRWKFRLNGSQLNFIMKWESGQRLDFGEWSSMHAWRWCLYDPDPSLKSGLSFVERRAWRRYQKRDRKKVKQCATQYATITSDLVVDDRSPSDWIYFALYTIYSYHTHIHTCLLYRCIHTTIISVYKDDHRFILLLATSIKKLPICGRK